MQRVIPPYQVDRSKVAQIGSTSASWPWNQVAAVAPPGDVRWVIRVHTPAGPRFRRYPAKLTRRPARVAKPVASATEEHIPTAIKGRNDDGR